mmetsp:Transcript_39515/g.51732  ORF Transcript_39515/g.51732 Transcript_39515/m.51732 type:complete len:229 (+) Transcript_39515:831-1517(+)
MLLGVFKLLRKLLHLHLLAVELLLELEDFFGEFGHFGHLFVDDLELSLTLFKLKFDHADLLLLLTDFLLAILEDVLLNVALFVENTELVIAVDQLDTHVVSGLTSVLVLVNQVVHFLLQRVNDQVQLVALVDQLPDRGELPTEFKLFAVGLGAVLVTLSVGLRLLLHDVDEVAVLLRAFELQNVDFVLEDLHALLHLSQVLTTGLNLAHILVSRVLDFFVKCDESVQL